MKGKRIKKSVDFSEENLKNMEVFKANYRRVSGSTKASNSFVIGMLLSTFGDLSDETRKIIAWSLTREIKKIHKARLTQPDYGMTFDMHAKKDLQTMDELKRIVDFITFGEGISVRFDEPNNMKKINAGTGYAEVPDDWIEIYPYEVQETDSVYVMEMRNSLRLSLPHFVFAAKGNPYKDEKRIYEKAMEAYPEFKAKVLDKQVKAKYDEDGKQVNLEEWGEAPTIGMFRIEDADDTRSNDEYPLGAKFYRRSE